MLEDAYVGAFAALMLIAIAVSVLRGLGDLTQAGCGPGCEGARAVAPAAIALGALALLVSLARLVGPVFVSPAVGSWLLASPVDRRGLLAPRAVLGALALVVGLGAVVAGSATAAGWPSFTATALVVTSLLLGVAVLGGTVRAQATRWGWVSRLLVALPGVAAWVLLLLVVTGTVAGADPRATPRWVEPASALVVALLVPLAIVGVVLASRSLPLLPRSRVARAGGLVPAVSGALATLDLSLAWDVVSDHRWRGRGAVRPRRGRWSGTGALVMADLIRLHRDPGRLLRLALVAVIPLATRAAGADEVNILVVTLVGFVAGLPLLSSLRVIERSPGLTRMLPFPTRTARAAAVVVPLGLLAAYGLALIPALAPVEGRPLLALAAGVAATTSAVRWMTGRPPDYSKPLVSTPAGGVPTNLYGSALRGFDMLLLTTAPMLISYSTTGAWCSLALSAVVLSVLLGRE